jgi:hypothetical protein
LNQQFLAALLAVAFSLSAAGCRREEKIKLEPTDESPATLSSSVHAADARTSIQLVKGFHPIEQNSWRWTMGQFSVTLKPPAGAAANGAVLVLKLALPEAVQQKTKTATVTAMVQKETVGKQTYTSPGEYTFRADVPASLLKADAVTVDFALDHFLPPGAVDARELGVVFISAALESK